MANIGELRYSLDKISPVSIGRMGRKHDAKLNTDGSILNRATLVTASMNGSQKKGNLREEKRWKKSGKRGKRVGVMSGREKARPCHEEGSNSSSRPSSESWDLSHETS